MGWLLLLSLLLIAPLLGLISQPYQWLSELGFRLQALWPLGSGEPLRPLLPLAPLLGTWVLVGLASGPLRQGVGGGVTPVLALQEAPTDEAAATGLARLSLRTQMIRLPLLALTHLAGLTVGIESPSAALGASLVLAARQKLLPLQALPAPLLAAAGGGAGLGVAFQSALLGVAYAVEELSGRLSFPLVSSCLILGSVGTLFASGLGAPAMDLLPIRAGVPPGALWPGLTALCLVGGLLGGLFVRLLAWASIKVGQGLQRRRLPVALGLGLAITALAVVSGGWSLNDGQLLMVHQVQGSDAPVPLWVLLPRGLAALLSLSMGAPGGLIHDTMSLGALLASPWLEELGGVERSTLVLGGAVALFSGACRTPLFCSLFVVRISGDASLLPVLLLVAAVAAVIGSWLAPATWNEVQLSRFLAVNARTAEDRSPAAGSVPPG
ncbi:chloride channel protein [Synechococcus sp. Tobar12-5m-g]|jgi:H+/Cl- antiporter ClcA|uniref:chloride channel protein n=1 Tax=unclassified Synechococcus TaxID=2626047 RepID=UPI0020CE09C5|nr:MULTISPECIES: chloride channel protein [unclassified Synechococcus]MCP9771976.1 chloride channel protein [Synechococcus sp. Tobar12-5m-g]MCP9872918.1 chloride channel protein [Synechococcus sp. Cruz CV-v-12]